MLSVSMLNVSLIAAILMSTDDVHFRNEIRHFPKIFLNIFFLELSEEIPIGSKEFEAATVNRPSVFESLTFCCIGTNSSEQTV